MWYLAGHGIYSLHDNSRGLKPREAPDFTQVFLRFTEGASLPSNPQQTFLSQIIMKRLPTLIAIDVHRMRQEVVNSQNKRQNISCQTGIIL